VAIVLPPLHRPSNTWKAFGKWGVLGQRLFDAFQRKKVGENRGKKNLLLPLLRASRGRRRPTVLFKTAMFRAFFFLTVYETTPFWTEYCSNPQCFFSRKNYKLNY
jgi:hypothetical protein